VAEQERLLKQRPVYADDSAPPMLGKIVNVPTAATAAAAVPTMPRGPPPRLASPTMLMLDAEAPLHPVCPLAFQPVTMTAPAPEPALDPFAVSVAKAMANELEWPA